VSKDHIIQLIEPGNMLFKLLEAAQKSAVQTGRLLP
jgi:hypothetical protein